MPDTHLHDIGIPRRSLVRAVVDTLSARIADTPRGEFCEILIAQRAALTPMLSRAVKLGADTVDAAIVGYLVVYVQGNEHVWPHLLAELDDCGYSGEEVERVRASAKDYARIVRLALGGSWAPVD